MSNSNIEQAMTEIKEVFFEGHLFYLPVGIYNYSPFTKQGRGYTSTLLKFASEGSVVNVIYTTGWTFIL